jgi:acid stress-induced BolA-like protein IbaG/YrbA
VSLDGKMGRWGDKEENTLLTSNHSSLVTPIKFIKECNAGVLTIPAIVKLDYETTVTTGVTMVSQEQVAAMIKEHIPDAQVQVQDLTGGGDHYQVTVVSSEFAGKTLVKQHQLVYAAVREAMSTEAIHALALKTYTPETWATAGQTI